MKSSAVAALVAGGLFAAGCGAAKPEPPLLTYQSVSFGGVAERSATQLFTEKTGIRVAHVPGAEVVDERLEQTRRALGRGPDGPDVVLVDLTWPQLLADDLMDLTPALGDETNGHLPMTVATDVAQGRLVALPAYTDVGLLFYRKDLLAKYGFAAPPATWDELETMAARIQAGERQAGNRAFHGFVWQGAPTEALTCNVLEWQRSHGGGPLVDRDGLIRVDDAGTVRALERAARWVGTISPPGVTSFLEEDARAVWQAGNAAFMRNWPYAWLPGEDHAAPIRGRYDVTRLPAGPGGHAHALGGWQLAVSRHTRHPKEAVEFVRFMSGPEAQRMRLAAGWNLPTRRELYAQAAGAHPRASLVTGIFAGEVVERPTVAAGAAYPRVSAAVAGSAHAILGGVPAKEELGRLRMKLEEMMREGRRR